MPDLQKHEALIILGVERAKRVTYEAISGTEAEAIAKRAANCFAQRRHESDLERLTALLAPAFLERIEGIATLHKDPDVRVLAEAVHALLSCKRGTDED